MRQLEGLAYSSRESLAYRLGTDGRFDKIKMSDTFMKFALKQERLGNLSKASMWLEEAIKEEQRGN